MIKIDLTKYQLWQEVKEKGCIVYYRDCQDAKMNKDLLNYIYDVLFGIKRQSKEDIKRDAELFVIVYPDLFQIKGFKFPYVYYIQNVPVAKDMFKLEELFIVEKKK